MKLQDKEYEDEDGKRINRSEIDTVGTYSYKADGFFEWDCSLCGHEHTDRAFAIQGVVFKCYNCKKRNLLLRSDVQYVKQVFRNAERRDSDNDKRAREALKHLGQAISALGE